MRAKTAEAAVIEARSAATAVISENSRLYREGSNLAQQMSQVCAGKIHAEEEVQRVKAQAEAVLAEARQQSAQDAERLARFIGYAESMDLRLHHSLSAADTPFAAPTAPPPVQLVITVGDCEQSAVQ